MRSFERELVKILNFEMTKFFKLIVRLKLYQFFKTSVHRKLYFQTAFAYAVTNVSVILNQSLIFNPVGWD